MSTSATTTIELEELSRGGSTIALSDKEVILPQRSQDELAEATPFSVQQNELSKRRSAAIIITVAGVNLLNVCGSGILTVALPQMGKDLGLPRELLLWPASIYALTCGCSLLLAGSMADIIGRRKVFLVGCFLCSCFTLGCGLAQTGTSLIVFRGFQGIAISLCLTTAVGIITNSFPPSTRRNIAFAVTGAAAPVGYTLGLVCGGLFVQSIGWRWAYYIATTINFILVGAAVWGLPGDEPATDVWGRIWREIDWVGAAMATVAISLLSYVMAVITGSSHVIKEPVNIALLTIALALFPTFVWWMHRQEKRGKPAIIPNSIWQNTAFTTSCLAVFLTWGAFNPFGYFATLYFQEVQMLSALQTSLRFLPTVVCGIAANIATGFLVKNTKASYLVAGSSAFSAVAALLMAIVDPQWSFWKCAFIAIFLSPMSSDVLYTCSNLIIASAFPLEKQSLAGGIFNTLAQIGNSVGLTIGAVLAASVSGTSKQHGESVVASDGHGIGPEQWMLLKGFRATFWLCFAAMSSVVILSGGGLRKAGKVGLKKD